MFIFRVPDRDAALEWYGKHLGFEPVERLSFWAEGFAGGPLQISADGGQTSLALFEASEGHPMIPNLAGVAFSLDAQDFMAFAQSLPCGIDNPQGESLKMSDIVDFDLCWAYNFKDPWDNRYELNCYDYDAVRRELIEAQNVTPMRYWPSDLYKKYKEP